MQKRMGDVWRRIKPVHWLALAIMLAGAIHFFALPKIISKSVAQLNGANEQSFVLPHIVPDAIMPGANATIGTYEYKLVIHYMPGQQTRFAFNPIGCVLQISVNGRIVPLQGASLCNYAAGFVYDFQDYLHPGNNVIEIRISNSQTYRGSRYYDTATFGLNVAPVLLAQARGTFPGILALLLVVVSMLFVARLMYEYTKEPVTGVILAMGLWRYLRHFVATDFMQYTIDMPSHLQYIAFIANHGFWPKTYYGWEYYHPPLYYHLQAMVIWAGNWLGSFDNITLLRFFSLVCYMWFMVVSILLLRRLVTHTIAYYAVLPVFVFYPMGVIHASRLDSHLLFYALYASCLHYLLSWLRENKASQLYVTLACFGLAVATRTNALVLMPIIALGVLYRWRGKTLDFSSLRTAGMVLSVLAVAAGVAANFGRTAYYHFTENNTMPFIVGNISSIQQTQRITNNMNNLLLLDIQQLFSPPFIDWWNDYTGRQHFWNAMLKTSLFEHFVWHSPKLASFILFTLIALIAYVIISSMAQTVEKRFEWRTAILTLLVPILMLMLNRILHPYAPSQDFRYIYPALASFCLLVALTIEQYLVRRNMVGAGIGIVMCLGFAAGSYAFIVAG